MLRFKAIPTILLGALVLPACDSGSASAPDQDTRLSVYLTDAPGDVAAIWVDVAEIYFQGGPGGRMPVSETPTGLIELLALRDQATELVSGLAIDPGIYSQLRFVLSSAVLETVEGEVYAFGGADHPDGLPVTGELKCPSCSNSGIKVKMSGDAVEVSEGANGLLLDFDVNQSLGRQLGNSGKWMLNPVVHATKVKADDPEDPESGSAITGTVALDESGETAVTIPMCPEGEARSIRDFIPLATATTLVDGDGASIVRSGEVEEDGSFEIEHAEADVYVMGHQAEIPLDAFKLVFDATVEPAEATVDGNTDVTGVSYTITDARCEATTGG